jgi:hypothetical protein
MNDIIEKYTNGNYGCHNIGPFLGKSIINLEQTANNRLKIYFDDNIKNSKGQSICFTGQFNMGAQFITDWEHVNFGGESNWNQVATILWSDIDKGCLEIQFDKYDI